MEMKRLLSLTRQAADKYKMIQDGDRILAGVSGGKDSIALLYALSGLRRFYPQKYEIEAVTIDAGFEMDYSDIQRICEELGIRYTVVNTQIKQIVFDEMKDKNPCALCSKFRRAALVSEAKRLGCNKIAFGHHKDDVVNTMMMSLMYEGRFQSLEPSTYYEDNDVTIIRPLIFVKESEVVGFINKNDIHVLKNECPADGNTKREYVDEVLRQLNKENPGVKDRMFTAITDYQYKNLYE